MLGLGLGLVCNRDLLTAGLVDGLGDGEGEARLGEGELGLVGGELGLVGGEEGLTPGDGDGLRLGVLTSTTTGMSMITLTPNPGSLYVLATLPIT